MCWGAKKDTPLNFRFCEQGTLAPLIELQQHSHKRNALALTDDVASGEGRDHTMVENFAVQEGGDVERLGHKRRPIYQRWYGTWWSP